MVDENTGHPDGTLFHGAGVVALRARFAGEPETGWPRWTLPLAWSFAIGIWLVVLFVLFAPGLTAETTVQDVTRLPPERIVQQPAEAPQAVLIRPRNCSEAEALGLAPAIAGQSGYAPWLDGDHDGIACERWGRGRY